MGKLTLVESLYKKVILGGIYQMGLAIMMEIQKGFKLTHTLLRFPLENTYMYFFCN